MLRNVLNSLTRMPQTRGQTMNIVRGLSAGNYKLEHDEKNNKVFLQLDPETTAFVDYKRLADKEVLLYHSEVPKKYGGKGIGNILASETFKFFDDRGDKMKITCDFLLKVKSKMEKK